MAPMTPPERMARVRALLPEIGGIDLKDMRRVDIALIGEIYRNLAALEECGALQDAEDIIEFTYGGAA